MTGEQQAEAQTLWTTTEKSATEIATLLSVSKNVIIGLADRRGWARPGKVKVLSERQKQIIELRKTTTLSFREIGHRLRVSKNVVQGVITREAAELVTPKGGEPRTLFQRCDELHARMDAVLAECKGIPRIAIGKNQLPAQTWGLPRTLARGMLADD